jgi:hypothetical protein
MLPDHDLPRIDWLWARRVQGGVALTDRGRPECSRSLNESRTGALLKPRSGKATPPSAEQASLKPWVSPHELRGQLSCCDARLYHQLAYRRIEQHLGRKARPGDRAGGQTGWGLAYIDAKLVSAILRTMIAQRCRHRRPWIDVLTPGRR